jgi:serine/threonine protein phosphatase PrpC
MAVTTRIQSAGLSDQGQKRDNNEDRFLCDAERGIFLVVDGMGGQAAGEKAAETAVSVIKARLERLTGSPEERIREAIALANNEILENARANPEWAGMACVLTVALVEEDRITVGHVGDSRLYLLEPGGIRKITHDHSPIGEREDAGGISERDAMDHPRRNEVFRDVGSVEHRPEDPDFIELVKMPFAPNQALLLCSDGLSDLLTSEEIRAIVESHAGRPRESVAALIDEANRAGGKDNVTAIVVEQSRYAAGVRALAASSDSQGAISRATEEPAEWHRNPWLFLVIGLSLGTLAGVALFMRPQQATGGAVTGDGAHARTWVVGAAQGTDGANIGAVLDKAQPGDTVTVTPGTYIEQVRMRDGIALLSQQPQGAVLQSDLTGAAVIANELKSGRISGFRIMADARHRLAVGLAIKDSNIEVDDIEISGADSAGVEIRGNASSVLRASRIVDNPGAGVAVYDTATPKLLHDLIAGNGNGERARRPGIEVHGEAALAIMGSTIADNMGGAIWISRQAQSRLHLDQNFFGSIKKGTTKPDIRVIPQ